jgi:hypothetical protein
MVNKSIPLVCLVLFAGKSMPHMMSQEPPMGETYCVAFEEGQAGGDDVAVDCDTDEVGVVSEVVGVGLEEDWGDGGE